MRSPQLRGSTVRVTATIAAGRPLWPSGNALIFMMRALELSELKSRQRYSHDTLAQTVGSGWVGYSKALHIAGSQPILLGDEVFGGLRWTPIVRQSEPLVKV